MARTALNTRDQHAAAPEGRGDRLPVESRRSAPALTPARDTPPPRHYCAAIPLLRRPNSRPLLYVHAMGQQQQSAAARPPPTHHRPPAQQPTRQYASPALAPHWARTGLRCGWFAAATSRPQRQKPPVCATRGRQGRRNDDWRGIRKVAERYGVTVYIRSEPHATGTTGRRRRRGGPRHSSRVGAIAASTPGVRLSTSVPNSVVVVVGLGDDEGGRAD